MDRDPQAGAASPRPWRRDVVLVALAFAFLAVTQVRTVTEPEFWSHLAAGRALAEQGAAALRDTLSFTAAGRPVRAPHALYDRALYALWSLGGVRLTVVAHGALLLGAFALAFRAGAARGPRGGAAAAALLLGGWLSASRSAAGPHTASLFLAALFLHELVRPRAFLRRAATLLAAQVLWANLDAAFLLGPLLVLLHAAEFWMDRRGAGGITADERRHALHLVALAAALAAASLAQPHGVGLLRATIFAGRASEAAGFRVWLSPYSALLGSTLFRNLVIAALLAGALGLVAFAQRLPLLITASALLGGFLALRSADAMPLFAVLALPFLLLAAQSIAREAAALLPPGPPARADAVARAARIAVAAAIVVSGALFVSGRHYRRVGSAAAFGLGADERLYPSAAAALLEHPGFPARALHLPLDGGYLAWRYPGRPVFCDLRRGLYDAEFERLVGRWLAGEPGVFETLARRWNAEALLINCLWPGAGRLAREALAGGWTLVYFDGTTAALLPRGRGGAAEIDPGIREAGLRRMEQDIDAFAAAVANGDPVPLAPAALGGAELFTALDRHREAADLYALLARAAPEARSLNLLLGIAQCRAGRAGEAVRPLEAAVRAAPRNGAAWFWLAQAYRETGRATEAERAGLQAERHARPAP